MKASAWFAASSFHSSTREAAPAAAPSVYVDTRPRVKYVRPDGRPVTLIVDHGETPRDVVDCEIGPSDPLWSDARRRAGTTSRFIDLRLAVGL